MSYNDEKKSKNTDKLSAKKQAEYVRFMFITVIAGVVICMAVFFAVFISMNSKRSSSKIQTSTESMSIQPTSSFETKFNEDESISIEPNSSEMKAVVLDVYSDSKKLKLYDFENDKDISLIMKAGADMKDQYGNIMTLAEFEEGDIVDILYNKNSMEYESIKISPNSWTLKSVTNLKLNAQASTITYGNDVYKYTDRLISKYGNSKFNILDLDSIDVATVKGYGSTIWSLNVEKSHGFVTITGKDKIKDGAVEIDTDIYKSLNESNRIKLREGEHKIVVKGSNIEPYVDQFAVLSTEEVNIDLSEVPIKTGVIIINANVNDYTLYVNGEQNSSVPIVLEYGQYDIKVTKEGYKDTNTKLLVNSPTVTLPVNLEEEEKETTKMGELSVSTGSVQEANVYVDNGYVGITPLSIKLTYGEHRVIVKKEGYSDVSTTVTIGESPQNIAFTLHESTQETPSQQSQQPTTSSNETTTSSTTKSSEVGGGQVDVKPIY